MTQFLEISDGPGSTRIEHVYEGLTGRPRVAIQGTYATYGLGDAKRIRAFLDDWIEKVEDSPWPT